MLFRVLVILLAPFFFVKIAFAQNEPDYCDPQKFVSKMQIPVPDPDQLLRPHAFKVGDVTLVGVAVGDSNLNALENLAKQMAFQGVDNHKFCTWYVNTGNVQAEETFNHDYVPSPFLVTSKWPEIFNWVDGKTEFIDPISLDDVNKAYLSSLKDAFSENQNSFLYCAENFHYVAMGCNIEKQRGPTVFGALLAFSGCSPDHASAIVNSIWSHYILYDYGSDVQEDVRLDIIQTFYNLGRQNQVVSQKLRNLFL